MYRFYSLEMNSGRQTDLVDEELPEDDKDEFFQPEDNWDEEHDDEPQEREYCD